MDKLNLNKHISNTYNEELEELRLKILEMGGLIGQQIDNAIKALSTHDGNYAQTVIEQEARVNQMQVDIDALCLDIMARRNPAASDLRLIIACLRIDSDLERMSDETKTIALLSEKMARDIGDAVPMSALQACGTELRAMTRDSLTAIARLDHDLALEVARRDKKVNALYRSTMTDLISHMRNHPEQIDNAMDISRTLRAIERIGDHCRNIAEHVIYLVKGVDVRHVSLSKMAATIADAQTNPE